MAEEDDDEITTAQRRPSRRRRSYFPAVNRDVERQNTRLKEYLQLVGPAGSRDDSQIARADYALTNMEPGSTSFTDPEGTRFQFSGIGGRSRPTGQVIQGSGAGNAGYGIGNGALPPDQNPAYQAALERGRVNRNNMTTVYLPSGGTIQVPNKSLGGTLAAIKGSTIQPKQAYATDYAKGYGAPQPVIQGGYQIAGGVANPIENLTPQQRVTGGAGTSLDYWKTNPSLNVARNLIPNVANNNQYASNLGSGLPNFGQIGTNIANWFRPQPQRRYSDVTPPRDYFNPTDRF